MRIFKLAIFILFQISFSAFAQITDIRLLSTKIADVLATMPAHNKVQLDKNMQSISDLGQKGMTQMISIFAAPGSGDNTALEYALNAYATYVIQPGKEPQRQTAVLAYCSGLEKVQNNKNKQFLIFQLQQFGKDDAVPCLEKYLMNKDLAGAAARALAQIKSPMAQKVLFKALPNSTGDIQLSLIEALGYVQYKTAVPSIIKLANTTNEKQRKVVLYSLAQIGDATAAKLLQTAAQKANFTYDNTNATSSYILYLQQLAKVNKLLAGQYATKLMQDAATGNQLHTRIAALKLSTDINGQKSLPLLYAAMQDKDIKYRAAALKFAASYQPAATNAEWIKLLNTVSPEAQVQILAFISQTANKSTLPSLKKFMQSNDESVRIAAIAAVAKVGQQESLPTLLTAMEKGNAATIEACKNAIQLIHGDALTTQVANALTRMTPAGKVALLNVLKARSADNAAGNVFTEINNNDAAVHEAAVKALPAVVMQKDLPQIFTLLNASKPEDVSYYQQAIINATAGIKDTAARTQLILQQVAKESNDKKSLYFNVLAAIGGSKALNELQTAFVNGDDQTKSAAVIALSKASGAHTARALIKIASTTTNTVYKETALNGYIDIIRKSSFPSDQKLLMLQDAMELATTTKQKQTILDEAGDCKSFTALTFAGKYLDDEAVQQEAALSVLNIASSNKDFSGEIVRSLLTKTMNVIKGRDADYQKKAIQKYLDEMPSGQDYVALFNGKDLSGWKGLVGNPILRAAMNADTLKAEQEKADKIMKDGWFAKNGLLVFSGHGENLCTQKQYGDFEMFVDWKITKDGDAGIYLRGTPQVQIWDTSRIDVGAQVGSGGLYNNQKNESKPLLLADNAIGEWNTFHIIMRGDKVTVYLNGKLVTDHVVLENFWDHKLPIFSKEQIELQAHGTYVAYRNIYLRELTGSEKFVLSDEEKKDGFKVLFDGTNIDQWTGNKVDYKVDNGILLIDPKDGEHGNLYTRDEFSDFIYRFEFQLTPGANNGVGIRAPLDGDAAYVGMEIQVLDNEAAIYKDLHPYQYHGSVYGVIPAKRGFLKPVGEWNYEEIVAKGNKIKVTLNGEVILDGDIAEASKNGTMDHNNHPGLKRTTGHIGFLGHGSVVRFRNIRMKEL
jgi:HEAT repeat protein